MGLMDIAPPEIVTKHFEVRGGTLEVRGIKTREWVALQQRFPELRAGMNGEPPDSQVVITAVDGLVPAIIAAALGAIGDEITEGLIVERLSESEQMVIFGVVMELTAGGTEQLVEGKKSGPLAKSMGKNRPPTVEHLPNGNAETPMKNSQQPSLL